MLEPAPAIPGKLPLATDMSVRCDRALDRALRLAGEFGAELVAAHVVDPADTPQYQLTGTRRSWRKLPDPTERMRRRLERDVANASVNVRTIVEEGDAVETLIEVASGRAAT